MGKEKICTETIAKTGIKSVILGFQSILDTISERSATRVESLERVLPTSSPA